jgi:hypothetical protein
MLRDCKKNFGDRETLALTSMLYAEADSKSAKQKLIRTAALVLGVSDVRLRETLETLDNVFRNVTVELADGTPILDGGEYVFKGFGDGGEENA